MQHLIKFNTLCYAQYISNWQETSVERKKNTLLSQPFCLVGIIYFDRKQLLKAICAICRACRITSSCSQEGVVVLKLSV